MDVVAVIGRILFALLFIASGMSHLTQSAAMTGYAQSKRLPAARAAVLVSGVWIIIGGLLVLLGLWGDLGALMLVLFLLGTAFVFHGFWQETDTGAKQNEMVQFLKDMALAGAAVLIFYLYLEADVGLTITGPLFG